MKYIKNITINKSISKGLFKNFPKFWMVIAHPSPYVASPQGDTNRKNPANTIKTKGVDIFTLLLL